MGQFHAYDVARFKGPERNEVLEVEKITEDFVECQCLFMLNDEFHLLLDRSSTQVLGTRHGDPEVQLPFCAGADWELDGIRYSILDAGGPRLEVGFYSTEPKPTRPSIEVVEPSAHTVEDYIIRSIEMSPFQHEQAYILGCGHAG